jgi:hypothetical protein
VLTSSETGEDEVIKVTLTPLQRGAVLAMSTIRRDKPVMAVLGLWTRSGSGMTAVSLTVALYLRQWLNGRRRLAGIVDVCRQQETFIKLAHLCYPGF